MRNVPKLRFKEFSNELINNYFFEFGDIKIGLTHTPTYVENGKIFLSSKNISKGYIDFEDVQYIAEEEFKTMPESTKPKKGDILFTRVGSNLGNPIILEEEKECAIFVSLGIFRVNDKANNYYIKHWMNTNYFWNQVEKKVAGGAKNNLNTTWLKEFKINIPTLQEQQKIANFLSNVDKKISITEEKLDLFKDYKKGIMQKIFNQELRFKDSNGNDYPEWQEKILGEVSSFINGKGHEQFIDKNGNYIVVNSKFISSDGLIKKYTSNLLVPLYVNDILMVMSDVPNGKAIGKCFLVNENNKYSLNQRICALRTGENSKYLYYFLNRNSYFLKFDDGISQTNLKKDEVLSCPIFLPCLEEQQKIADFLSSIDNKIDNLTAELEDLKEFKKGLLQQMFV